MEVWFYLLIMFNYVYHRYNDSILTCNTLIRWTSFKLNHQISICYTGARYDRNCAQFGTNWDFLRSVGLFVSAFLLVDPKCTDRYTYLKTTVLTSSCLKKSMNSPILCESGHSSGQSGMAVVWHGAGRNYQKCHTQGSKIRHPTWVISAPNVTNLGLFKISVSTFSAQYSFSSSSKNVLKLILKKSQICPIYCQSAIPGVWRSKM